jgi:hypothetical protein
MSSPSPETLRLDKLATPIGTALLLTDGAGALRALDWQEFEAPVPRAGCDAQSALCLFCG